MSTMELRQSILQEIALLLDNDQAMEKLHRYVKQLRVDVMKAPNVTQDELDKRIQASIDGPDATQEELNGFFEKWGCGK